MEGIGNIIAGHQLVLIVVLLVAVFVVYFIFKKLMSCLILSLLILLSIGAYFYFSGSIHSPADLWRSFQQTRQKTQHFVEEGKDAYQKGKNLVDRGKKLTEDADRFLDRSEQAP
ncbi:MAG: hypothetical protein PHY31_10265 [Smithellaceae bacterium]|nr:hypothetical protein [Smithellaceae bacterium]